MSRRGDPAHQSVFNAAEHLFADLGYDQTSVQLIADAAGVPVETVGEEFGGKRQLYLDVMENVRLEGEKAFAKVVENYTPDAGGIHYLVDATLDHFLRRPQDAGLWLQRRLQDAADLTEVDQRGSGPQLARVLTLTRSAFRQDLDQGLVLQDLFWSVHDFVRGGIFDDAGERMGPEDPEAVDRFRRHLHRMVSLYTGETG
ncbi:TetR/AcrR family transcriptional regulator [Actinocorallia populi]|uniref:TetR/AcrR family transcriptional regulator n=1 Tax=Actinocorallia populi TaxID=2079200 RepID=UPI000D08AA2A|nr:TetR/AcrR family transcriptional regulator [Actinocorallia populi]